MTMIILSQILSQWTMNKILFCVSPTPIGRFEKLNLPVGDFLYSGKLWTRVVQFHSLLCNGDEKPLRGSEFIIRCCSTIYTNFISEGHVIQSQRKTERKRGFWGVFSRLSGTDRKSRFCKSFCVRHFYGTKKASRLTGWNSFGSGGGNRTNGLQVMSLTSYHCSTPQRLFI